MRVCILSIAALFLLVENSIAQKISELKFYDTMVHVFKLNYDQTKFVLTNGKVTDTSYLYTKKFRLYPKDRFRADTLPYGHFVTASIFANRITYQYVAHQPFELITRSSENEIVFYFRDKKNEKRLLKAKVELDGMPLVYDPGVGGYSILKKNINRSLVKEGKSFLKVSYDGEIYAHTFDFKDGSKPAKESDYYSSSQSHFVSPGYMILDKPIYKPLDTLNLKSFVMFHKNGRPIRRKAYINIKESSQSYAFTKKIKTTSPGAYVFKWVIPDTLKLDRTYTVDLNYTKKGRSFYRQSQFKLEEYELNKNKYDVEMIEENFYAGDDVKFYASATDMNGFPLQGTRIGYKLRIAEVMNVFKDTFYLSKEKGYTWYEKDTTIEYTSLSECTLPSTIFPPINGKYNLDITFTDPVTFEKKAFTKSFLKYTQKEKLLFVQSGDSIIVRSLYNGKDTSKMYRFWSLQNKDTLVNKEIETPFVYQLRQNETQVNIMDKDSSIRTINIQFNPLEMLYAKGRRSGDSIFISFAYPFPEPVHYRIYKKDKLVKSGETNTLKFALPDNSLDEYKIVMTTDLHNHISTNYFQMTFVPEKNRLHFEKSIQGTALPGDSMSVVLRVLDYKNKPVPKINIASYAVNAAFEDQIQSPIIRVPLKYQNNMEVDVLTEQGQVFLKTDAASGEFILRNHHFKRFDLYRNELYSFIFPVKGVQEAKLKKQDPKPEFSVCIVIGENIYTPRYLLLDDKPIYVSDISMHRLYSFGASAGKHKIKFRVMDRTFEWDQMQLESNTKHVFSFNMDSIKSTDARFKIQDSLPLFEPNVSEKEMLYTSFWISSVFSADSMEIVSSDINYNRKHVGFYGIARLTIDGDLYMVHGPLDKDQTYTVKVNNKASFLKPGVKTVYHWDYLLQEFEKRPMGDIKGAFLSFSEVPLNHADILSLLIPDTLVVKPQEVTAMSKRPVDFKNQQEEQYLYQNLTPKSPGNDVQLILDNTSDSVFVKSLWIISKKDFGASNYIARVGKSFSVYGFRESGDSVDIYLFINKNRMVVLRDIQLFKGDRLYINRSLLKKVEFNKDKITEPLKIYAELNAVPLVPFYHKPNESKEQVKKVGSSRNNIYFHGMITSELQQPLSGALVYLEVNGKFRFGAITNRNGLFEMMDLPSATYQVKVYHPSYKISHHTPILFEANTEYELNTSLLSTELNAPAYELVHNDFRFMAFADFVPYDMLKLSLYEKDSRTRMENVTFSLKHEGKVVKTMMINESDFEIPFPYDAEGKQYTVELSKPGYTTLVFNNIGFVNKYVYILEAFLGLKSKEILSKKEYNFNINQELTPLAEHGEDSKAIWIEQDARPGKEEIFGRVTNDSGRPLDYASIKVVERGVFKGGSKSDENGNYKIKPLAPGKYSVTVTYAGYVGEELEGVILYPNKRLEVNFKLEKKTATTSKEVVIKTFKRQLIEPGSPTGKGMTKQEIRESASISTGDFAAMQGGMYQRKAGDGLVNAGGDRMSNTTYMVDGSMIGSSRNVKIVQGESGNSQSGVLSKYGNASTQYADQKLIEQVVANKNISTTRRKFSDVGYWQPNMISNKKGEVAFTIKLPDNITLWKSYVIGVGRKWLHGIDSSQTKVYKPLQTICLVPNYLYQGDKLQAKVKFQNLTDAPLDIKTMLSVQGKDVNSRKVNIKTTIVDSVWLEAGKFDTLRFEGGLTYQERYKDAEHYDIPILSPLFTSYSSQAFLMNKDSTYRLIVDRQAKGEIIFSNSLYEKIVAIANELGKYEYNCVEQTSSKLSGLLLKEQIQIQLKQKNTCAKEINALMGRLSDMQGIDGSFSWWRAVASDYRMTAYVMEVTAHALRRGYQNNVYNAAKTFLIQHYAAMNESDKIYVANLLLNDGHFNDQNRISYSKVNKEVLNPTDRLYVLKNRMVMNEEVSKEEMYKAILELRQSSRVRYSESFFYDHKFNLFLAYSLFRNTPYGKDLIDLFKRKLLAGEFEKELNTFSQAKLIEALMTEANADSSKPILASLYINDSIRVKEFPFRMKINTSEYRIQHQGGDVFVQTSERHQIENPIVRDSLLSIKTSFMQKGNTTSTIKAGEECTLNIHLHAFKKGEYVMVEIPIPSGFKVAKKETNYNRGEYIEYFKHKVVFFFNSMEMGAKQLQVKLLPLFKGDFIMPASKISLMYYPFVYGNTEQKKVTVE